MDAGELQKFLLNAGLSQLRRFSEDPNLQFESIIFSEKELEFPVLGHWLASILVATPLFKLTLKAHYSIPDISSLLLRNKTVDLKLGDDPLTAREFGKELVNWWAGETKRWILVSLGMDTEMGLPLTTRGFDELFSRRSNSRDCFFSATKITTQPGDHLWLSTLTEISVPSEFEAHPGDFGFDNSSQNTSGDVEFL